MRTPTMSEIKSEKAKELLEAAIFHTGKIRGAVLFKSAWTAVELAEIEAEERHAVEMQALKDKAVETFRLYCSWRTASMCAADPHRRYGYLCSEKNCKPLQLFTQKLTEKQ